MKLNMKVLLIFLLFLISNVALAKSCWLNYVTANSENYVQTVIEQSSYIFVGEAIESVVTIDQEKGEEEYLSKSSAVFVVSEWLKGKKEGEVLVNGNDLGECGCKYRFDPGVTYLVFGLGKSNVVTGFCPLIAPKSNSNYKEIVKEIELIG